MCLSGSSCLALLRDPLESGATRWNLAGTRSCPEDAEFDRMDLVARTNNDHIDHRQRMLPSEQLPIAVYL
ncbi:hypothetical protein OH76DRAFT_1402309 [Lentinus brumalis]|uniref:Uncharacterized protein n=1 Tax=Lentinus brumalis TaxID=2498619 RepID=A0A371DDU2_9APHY|nr:hypothetical protein OH76DRAFT_1402309 [Polyporus brumalis]